MDLFLELFAEFFGSIISAFVLPDPDKETSRAGKAAIIVFGVFSILMLAVLGAGVYTLIDPEGINQNSKAQNLGLILTVIGGAYTGLLIIVKIISLIIKRIRDKRNERL